MTTRKAKNNNLDEYRKKLSESNEALVKKAIAHIVALSGEVMFSSVSKVTYELADIQIGQTGITVAGISTSSVYRPLVEEAQANQEIHGRASRGTINHFSKGDAQLMLHALRVENVNLKRDNKILTLKLKEIPDVIETVTPIRDSIIQKGNALQDIARSMVTRLCELELAYIDADTNSLKLTYYDEIIVHNEALKLFYEKELNDIQSKIREGVTNG